MRKVRVAHRIFFVNRNIGLGRRQNPHAEDEAREGATYAPPPPPSSHHAKEEMDPEGTLSGDSSREEESYELRTLKRAAASPTEVSRLFGVMPTPSLLKKEAGMSKFKASLSVNKGTETEQVDVVLSVLAVEASA